MELPQPLNYATDSNIQPICLGLEEDIPFGGKAVASGWGRLAFGRSTVFFFLLFFFGFVIHLVHGKKILRHTAVVLFLFFFCGKRLSTDAPCSHLLLHHLLSVDEVNGELPFPRPSSPLLPCTIPSGYNEIISYYTLLDNWYFTTFQPWYRNVSVNFLKYCIDFLCPIKIFATLYGIHILNRWVNTWRPAGGRVRYHHNKRVPAEGFFTTRHKLGSVCIDSL